MFKTYVGDPYKIFNDGDVICATTNGIVKNTDKKAVMGAGTAQFMRDTFKPYAIDTRMGIYLKKFGNRAFYLGMYPFPNVKGFEQSQGKKLHLASFPTKNHYNDNSDKELIKNSTEQLILMADRREFKRIYIPMPGCGLGNLKWSEVKDILSPLDERFIIYSRHQKDFNI